MRRVLLALLVLVVLVPGVSEAKRRPRHNAADPVVTVPPASDTPNPPLLCDYYAAPDTATVPGSASNNGLTSSAPIRITDFWALASAGKTLCLLGTDPTSTTSGLYRGAANMIAPSLQGAAAALSGTAGSPITIVAVNDGGVRIDGQSARRPCYLYQNSYFTLKGFDCGWPSDSSLYIRRSDHVVIQRVIAIDALDTGNNQVCLNESSTNGTWEDFACIGAGIEVLLDYSEVPGNEPSTSYRRGFVRAEGSRYGAVVGMEMNYAEYTGLNPYGNSLAENMILVFDGSRGSAVGNSHAAGIIRWNGRSPYFRLMGAMLYYDGNGTVTQPNVGIFNDGGYSGIVLQDVISHANGLGQKPFVLRSGESLSPIQARTATRLTSVRGSVASTFGTWTVTNQVEDTTIAGTQFDYTGTNNTAKLCYRYVDGTYTTTPLWPWPMNGRITAAVAANAANGSPAFTGGTLQDEIEALFGTIPAGCKTGG